MRDIERHPTGGQLLDPAEQLVLGAGIEGGRGLIENEDLRIPHERACQRDLLPLAARELMPSLEPLAEGCLEAVRQFRDDVERSGAVGGVADLVQIVHVLDVADADVVRGGELVGRVVLEHDAELPTDLRRVVRADIPTVDQDLTFGRVVEPPQQLDHGRFAGAIATDQRNRLARLDGEREIAQGELLPSGILVTDIAELDSLAKRNADRYGIVRPGDTGVLRE